MKVFNSSRAYLLVSFLIFATACGKMETIPDQIADDTAKLGACPSSSYSDKIRDTLAQAMIDGKALPSEDELRDSLERRFDVSDTNQSRLVEDVLQTYRLMTAETSTRLQLKDSSEMLQAMVALDIGDRTTPERAALVDELQSQFSKIHQSAAAAGSSCDEPIPSPTPVPTPPPNTSSSKPAILNGALRVMTTAYQGCQALRLPAMTSSTPDAQGITVTGKYSETGPGLIRAVTDLAALNRTHYYVKEGSLQGGSCFDVTKKPLIYDYGGKPSTTSADDSPLDLFTNAGGDTAVLGIDCSGFVFSALAVQGLRAISGKKLKALQVHGISSSMLMNPQSNGLTCLTAPSMDAQAPLRSGDIMAINGHVVIVDVTSSDPFGLARAQSVSDCTTAKLPSSGFKFDILQSSPVKNGIGLDRMKAADYLSGTIGSAFVSYAVSACKVKFGKAADPLPSTGHIVRHKGTPECLDSKVSLSRESCVQSCYAGSGVVADSSL